MIFEGIAGPPGHSWPSPSDRVQLDFCAAGAAGVAGQAVAALNRAVAARVTADQLAAADAVLRAAIDDERVARLAAFLSPPPSRPV